VALPWSSPALVISGTNQRIKVGAFLGVNIDHVATVRQARYAKNASSINVEPDPVEAALAAERGGAIGITAHLRQDRRHVVDRDIFRLKEAIGTKLNLEMGNSTEIVAIALKVLPADVCLVPESREEVTTEGGLDCVTHRTALEPTLKAMRDAGIRVSLFIDPEPDQIAAAVALGAPVVELHTGAYAEASGAAREAELARLIEAARLATDAGIQVNAGHGLNYTNVGPILTLPKLVELNIGHSIVARALFVGLEQATREMVALLA
jgi:pyridoxine 5-phosphate synthase